MRLRGKRLGGSAGPQQADPATAPRPVAVDPADEPGHTRAFTVPEMPAASPGGSGSEGSGYDSSGYEGSDYEGSEYAEEHVAVYRAGQPHPQVGTERLPWRELLLGVVRHPTRTFAQMRGHQVWAPALIVSAVYGLLATFAFGSTSDQVLHSTFGTAVTILLSSAAGFVLAGLMLSSVTHALARRLGGDGAYAPTAGLAMLISWMTDAPRLLLALFLPTGNGVVQLLGWATWALCAWLLAAMVRQLHDLPWGKALTASALQLIMLLALIKLPLLG